MKNRVRWSRAWRALIRANTRALVRLACEETHKVEHEALTADVMALLASCVWHERRAPGLLARRGVGGRPLWLFGQRHSVERAPLGTVAIIATWNYPIQLLGIQLLQAVMAGNRVVVKPSEHAPRTQGYLLKLAREAGLDESRLRWTPATRDAGPALLNSGGIDHVVFTGSTSVGRQVAAWAAQHLVGTTLELSGEDSAIVLADADPDLAARTIWNAVTMNSGQTCMAPRRAIVSGPVYGAFIAAMSRCAAGARHTTMIDAHAAAVCKRLVADAVAHGGRILSGVDEWGCNPLVPLASGGVRVMPVALADCEPDVAIVRGEHFGPALAIVPAADDGAALAIHRRFGQRLSTSIFTRETARARRIAAGLGSGFVTINDTVLPTVHPGVAICGRGLSGWGASRGEEGLLAMTRPVYVSTTGTRLRLPIEPPDERRLSMLYRMTGWIYGRPGRVVEPDAPVRADQDGNARTEPKPVGINANNGCARGAGETVQ